MSDRKWWCLNVSISSALSVFCLTMCVFSLIDGRWWSSLLQVGVAAALWVTPFNDESFRKDIRKLSDISDFEVEVDVFSAIIIRVGIVSSFVGLIGVIAFE